jgi:hypothetical protein
VGPSLAAAAGVVGLLGVLGFSAARAVPREPEPSPQRPYRQRRTGWRQAVLTAVLALLGGGALLLTRLPGFDQVASALPADLLGHLPAIAALGLVLAAVAIARLRLFRAAAPRRRGTVSRLLAATQLGRSPAQHAALALVLDLSAALGVFAALAFVSGLTADASGPPALRAGAEVGLAAGAVAALALALAAFAVHFRWAARRRLGEYGGLFAHGLRTAEVARSLAAEQRPVTGSSLLAGGLLGAALALAVLPPPQWSQTVLVLAALGVGVFLSGLVVGALAVGSVVRRLPARVNPLPDRWQW